MKPIAYAILEPTTIEAWGPLPPREGWAVVCPACGHCIATTTDRETMLPTVHVVRHPEKDHPDGTRFYGPRAGWWKDGYEYRIWDSDQITARKGTEDYLPMPSPVDTVCTNRACARRLRIDPERA